MRLKRIESKRYQNAVNMTPIFGVVFAFFSLFVGSAAPQGVDVKPIVIILIILSVGAFMWYLLIELIKILFNENAGTDT